MEEESYFKYSPAVLLVPMVAVLIIWTVFWAEVRFQINFNIYGVYPRTLKGLRGVVFGHFIHGSVSHLYNNTLPIAILLGALFYFYRRIALKVLLWGILGTGIITWLIARPSYHIGASGVIYLLASFIFFKGIRTRHFRLIALSLAVVFIYGGLLWYIFPVEGGISWEGHLSGFLMGLLLAYVVKSPLPVKKKYDWEKEDYNEDDDPFLQQFDEDGNFIGESEKKESDMRIVYTYKENKENKTE